MTELALKATKQRLTETHKRESGTPKRKGGTVLSSGSSTPIRIQATAPSILENVLCLAHLQETDSLSHHSNLYLPTLA